MTGISCTAKSETLVGMGQISLGCDDALLRSVLGSCIGVAIYDERRHIAAFAHIVLPTSAGRPVGSPGKCVDTAIPWMVNALRCAGADPQRLAAKLTGGANMFSANGPFKIGQSNADEARRSLRDFRIRIVGEELGGKHGRRVTFDCNTCQFTIEIAGNDAATL